MTLCFCVALYSSYAFWFAELNDTFDPIEDCCTRKMGRLANVIVLCFKTQDHLLHFLQSSHSQKILFGKDNLQYNTLF